MDDIVIQRGEFDWRSLFGDENALTTALGEFEDTEDAHAAAVAAREEVDLEGADEADFDEPPTPVVTEPGTAVQSTPVPMEEDDDVGHNIADEGVVEEEEGGDEDDEGGTTVDYMLAFVQFDMDFFREWRV